jgi:hypothetical protein
VSCVVIDISQYRLLFGFFLLYMDRVPFELLDSATHYEGRAAVEGEQIVFLNLTTIILMAALCRQYMTSQVEDLSSIYS